MDNPDTNILSLCTGGAGMELGLGLALPRTRLVCAVERESYCAAVLLARMEEAALEPCPVWCGDMAEFDGKPWRGIVDIVSAGVPCQPWSVAGKRAGQADDRDLWPDAARIIGEVEPECVFVENVPGILVRGGFDRMASTLREMGYAVAAGLFSAAETGATHRRLRLFVMAHATCGGIQGAGVQRHGESEGVPGAVRRGEVLANPPAAQGRGNGQERGQDSRAAAGRAGEDVGNAAELRFCGTGANPRKTSADSAGKERGVYESAGAGALSLDDAQPQIPIFPPGPADLDAWREVLQVAPSLEPALCGVADGLAPRVDRLRMLGNGVVPLQAATAFVSLYAALTHGNDPASRGASSVS